MLICRSLNQEGLMIQFLGVLIVLGGFGMVITAIDGLPQHLQVQEVRR